MLQPGGCLFSATCREPAERAAVLAAAGLELLSSEPVFREGPTSPCPTFSVLVVRKLRRGGVAAGGGGAPQDNGRDTGRQQL